MDEVWSELANAEWLDHADPALATKIKELTWVADGLYLDERETVQGLLYMAVGSLPRTSQIVDMPYLKTFEPQDQTATVSLMRLVNFQQKHFETIIEHQTLSGGVEDSDTPVVSTLYGVASTKPALIEVLLDPSKVLLESRTITLPLRGSVLLDIIRTSPGPARGMDILERSVIGAEEFMGVPFPAGYVVLLYEDALPHYAAGTYNGTHITIRPEYDVDDGSHEASHTGNINAHEVAHYYWAGNRNWLDEGAADLMALHVADPESVRPKRVTNIPCGYVRSIRELESLELSGAAGAFGCNYSLGERLFADLYRTLGDSQFHEALSSLYLDESDTLGIEQLRSAFSSDDNREVEVIDRWYFGRRAYDPSPVDPLLPEINGRIEEVQVVASTDAEAPRVDVLSAQEIDDWVWLRLKYSYRRPEGAPSEIPIEIVEYYEDGFEFRRRSRSLTPESGYIGYTHWYSIGTPPTVEWALGYYTVYVYSGGRKLAEVEYLVIP